jgi:hypothetical protein
MPPTVARLAVEMSGANRSPCGFRRGVQLVEHDARLDARPALLDVHVEQPVQVLRRVEDESRPMAWPACDVPPPRRVSGQRKSRQIRTARMRSSRVLPIITPSGSIW